MAQQMVYHSILKGMCFAELLGVVLYKCQLMIKVVDSVQITSAFIYHCLVLLKSPIIIIELSVSHLTSVPIHPGMFYVWVCFCVWDLKNQKSLVVYYAHCSLSLCFCTLFLSLNSSQGSFYFNIYILLSASLFQMTIIFHYMTSIIRLTSPYYWTLGQLLVFCYFKQHPSAYPLCIYEGIFVR